MEPIFRLRLVILPLPITMIQNVIFTGILVKIRFFIPTILRIRSILNLWVIHHWSMLVIRTPPQVMALFQILERNPIFIIWSSNMNNFNPQTTPQGLTQFRLKFIVLRVILLMRLFVIILLMVAILLQNYL